MMGVSTASSSSQQRGGPNLDRISLRRRRRLQTKICDTLIAFRLIDRRKDPKKKCYAGCSLEAGNINVRADVLTGIPSLLGILNKLRLLHFPSNVPVASMYLQILDDVL